MDKPKKKKKKQQTLFPSSKLEKWREEWQDMPEFIQKDKWEYQAIIVRFNSEKDIKEFAKLINQTITPLTKSIWFPKINEIAGTKFIGMDSGKRYIDES